MALKSDEQLIETLFELGHFFSPEALAIGLVHYDEVARLTINEAVVKAAVRSFQSFMAPKLDQFRLKAGWPIGAHDGVLDMPTRELFNVPRCGHADYLHPDERPKLSGAGSWPDPCQKAGVGYNINKTGCPAALLPNLAAVMADVVAAYAGVGLNLVEVESPQQANIQCFFGSFGGSVIGLSEFNNGSCQNQVTSKLSNSYVGYNRSLIVHEWGHCCNLQHTRGGIMNPYILPDPSPFGWHADDPSMPVLQRFFGGQPITPPSPPPTPIPPTPNPTPDPRPTPFGYLKMPLTMLDADGKKYYLTLWPQV